MSLPGTDISPKVNPIFADMYYRCATAVRIYYTYGRHGWYQKGKGSPYDIIFCFYGTRKENKSKGPPALMAEGGKLEDKFQ